MRHLTLAAVAALALASVNCGDSVAPADLVGTWNATKLEFTNLANASESVDIVALEGAFTITITANGTWQATLTLPGEDPQVGGGTFDLSGSDLVLYETGDPVGTDYSVSLSGNTLTITSTDLTFDFGNGEVAARLDGILVRQ
jgi:hypothetical protein